MYWLKNLLTDGPQDGRKGLGTGPHVNLLSPCLAHLLPRNLAPFHCHLPSYCRE